MLSGLLASVLSGSGVGLLGSVLGKVTQWFQKKEDHKLLIEQKKLDIELLERSSKLGIDLEKSKGSWNALQTSLESDYRMAEYTPSWANALKALYRPVLTTLLVCLSFVIYLDLLNALTVINSDSALYQILGKESATEIIQYVVYTIVYCASVAVTWWFADRSMKPPSISKKD